MALQCIIGSGARPELGKQGRLTGGRPMAGLGRLRGSTGATTAGRTTICRQARHFISLLVEAKPGDPCPNGPKVRSHLRQGCLSEIWESGGQHLKQDMTLDADYAMILMYSN